MHPTSYMHPTCISLIQFSLSRFLVNQPTNQLPGLGVFQIVRLLFCPFQDRNLPPSPVFAGLLYFALLLPCQPLRARIFTHIQRTTSYRIAEINAHHLIPLGGGGCRQRPSSKASSRCCIRCASHGFGTGPGPGPGPGTNLGPAGCPGPCPGLSQAHGGG